MSNVAPSAPVVNSLNPLSSNAMQLTIAMAVLLIRAVVHTTIRSASTSRPPLVH